MPMPMPIPMGRKRDSSSRVRRRRCLRLVVTVAFAVAVALCLVSGRDNDVASGSSGVAIFVGAESVDAATAPNIDRGRDNGHSEEADLTVDEAGNSNQHQQPVDSRTTNRLVDESVRNTAEAATITTTTTTTTTAAIATIERVSVRPAEGGDRNRWVATIQFTMPETEAATSPDAQPARYESCYVVRGQTGTATERLGQRQVCVRGHVESSVLGDVGDDDDDDDDGPIPGLPHDEHVMKASGAGDTPVPSHDPASSDGTGKDRHRGDVIRVGDKVYQPPFDQYGSEALRRHFATYADGQVGTDPADHAEWLMILGDRYQDDFEDDDNDKDDLREGHGTGRSGTSSGATRRRGAAGGSGSATTSMAARRGATTTATRSGSGAAPTMHSLSQRAQNLEHAVNAYKQAVKILAMIVRSAGGGASKSATRKSNSFDDDDMANYVMDVKFQLANAYFAISDAYAGVSGPPVWGVDRDGGYDDGEGFVRDADASDASNRPRNHRLAVSYMKLSEVSYRRILVEASDWLDTTSLRTAQVARAVCCARLGVLMLEDPGLDDALNRIGGSVSTGFDNVNVDDPSQRLGAESSVEQLTRQYYQVMADQGELAMGYFQEAETIYRDAMAGSDRIAAKRTSPTPSTASGTPSSNALEFDYATVLHNMATASTYRGHDYETTVRYGVQAIEHYQAVLARQPTKWGSAAAWDDELNLDGLPSAVGELLLLVSDSYLKLRQYEECKTYYVRCMAWYERHELSAPLTSTGAMMMGSLDGLGGAGGGALGAVGSAIEEYERTLDEYKTLLLEQSGVVPEGVDDNAFDVQPQDGYEGDLHMNLGSLYLANGDIFTAISHLQQAASLYERSDEKTDEANVADVKFTLAALHFRNGDYPASIQLHGQAVDLYRRTDDDDTTPMDEVIPHVQPTVTFLLHPLDSDAELENDQGGSALQKSATSRNSATDPVVQSASSTEAQDDKAQRLARSDEHGGKADPVLAMMNFWYAALANDTDASTATSVAKELDRDEL